jgi:hypothetical protein
VFCGWLAPRIRPVRPHSRTPPRKSPEPIWPFQAGFSAWPDRAAHRSLTAAMRRLGTTNLTRFRGSFHE